MDPKTTERSVQEAAEANILEVRESGRKILAILEENSQDLQVLQEKLGTWYQASAQKAQEFYELLQQMAIDFYRDLARKENPQSLSSSIEGYYQAWDIWMGNYNDVWMEVYEALKEKEALVIQKLCSSNNPDQAEAGLALDKDYKTARSAVYRAYSDAWTRAYAIYTAIKGAFQKGNPDVEAVVQEVLERQGNVSTLIRRK